MLKRYAKRCKSATIRYLVVLSTVLSTALSTILLMSAGKIAKMLKKSVARNSIGYLYPPTEGVILLAILNLKDFIV